jgi:hypothetical protein
MSTLFMNVDGKLDETIIAMNMSTRALANEDSLALTSAIASTQLLDNHMSKKASDVSKKKSRAKATPNVSATTTRARRKNVSRKE